MFDSVTEINSDNIGTGASECQLNCKQPIRRTGTRMQTSLMGKHREQNCRQMPLQVYELTVCNFLYWVLLTHYMQHGRMSDRLPNAIVHFTHIHSFISFPNMAQLESSRQQFCSVGGYCATRLVPCYLWRWIAHCTALQRHIWTCIQYISYQEW
jgi:hypothetical protein